MSKWKTEKCGIYCIENLINHKKYIGQSVCIYARWSKHKGELNKNIHANTYLQRSWNKYGKENFKFSVLEECDKEILTLKEREYIKLYDCNIPSGFNMAMADDFHYHSEETRRKIGESAKRSMTPERKEKDRKLKQGNKVMQNSSSKYVGVSYEKDRNKWSANLYMNNIHIKIGRFNTEIEAAKAYDLYVLQNLGSDYRINFPEESKEIETNGSTNVS